mgnify:FL=1
MTKQGRFLQVENALLCLEAQDEKEVSFYA